MKRVAIIGGGPAGVGAAICLARLGIEARVLEAGDRPFAGLRRLDPSMRLLSPARLSRLPAMEMPAHAPTYLSVAELLELADDTIAEQRIEVETRARVASVRLVGGGFEIDGSMGSFRASHVVYAGGTISEPALPGGFEGDQCAIEWRHSRDLRASDIAPGSRVLVVGAGNSSAEAIALAHAAGATVSVSARSRIVSVPRRVLGIDTHYAVWAPEHLPATLPGVRRLLAAERPFGLRRILAESRAQRVGPIARYDARQVVFASGHREAPDLIVFATGYRYGATALGALVDRDARGVPRVQRCESTRAPGLYLLGLRFGRTLASHFLRGIARDARSVAARIGAGA